MGVSENTETLRREVLLLRGELAQERARGEAARIAYEAELADITEEWAPLFQQFHQHIEGVPCIDCARQRCRPKGRHRRYQAGIAGLPALFLGKASFALIAAAAGAERPHIHAAALALAASPNAHSLLSTLLSTLPAPG